MFMKEYQSNSHAGFYTKWSSIFIYYFKLTRSPSREPELRHSGSSSGSGRKFRLLAAPAPQHWSKEWSTECVEAWGRIQVEEKSRDF
jgi:hypothetical protein